MGKKEEMITIHKIKDNMERNHNRFNQVARITVFFWIMKVLATTLGEVFGDFFQ